MPDHNNIVRFRPGAKIAAGLDEALQHSRGEIDAKVHHIDLAGSPSGQRRALSTPLARADLFERIGDALQSREGLIAYVAFVAGCFFTVALAFVWSFWL